MNSQPSSHSFSWWSMIVLYLSINSLFILKYGFRINILLSVMVWATYCSAFLLIIRYVKIKSVSTKIILLITLMGTMALIIAQMSIDPYLLKVDRWSAIHNFLHDLLAGIYPYSAQTHLGGYASPFPVWQILHLPFYALGNVGLSVFVFFALYIYSIKRLTNNNITTFYILVLMLFSPAFIYEILVRSDLITNFLVCATAINFYLIYRVDANKHAYFIAFVCGLFLSTRLLTVIPMAIFLLPYYLQISRKKQIITPFIMIITFVFTFFPFAFWNFNELFFYEENPFILQTGQGSWISLIVLIFLLIYTGMTWKNDNIKLFRNVAFTLIVFIAVSFIHNMIINENFDAFFSSTYDITYFSTALPFICISLALQLSNHRFQTVEKVEINYSKANY